MRNDDGAIIINNVTITIPLVPSPTLPSSHPHPYATLILPGDSLDIEYIMAKRCQAGYSLDAGKNLQVIILSTHPLTPSQPTLSTLSTLSTHCIPLNLSPPSQLLISPLSQLLLTPPYPQVLSEEMDLDNDNDNDDDVMIEQRFSQGLAPGLAPGLVQGTNHSLKVPEKAMTAHTSSRALFNLWSWIDRVEAIIATQQQHQQQHHATTSQYHHQQDQQHTHTHPTAVLSLTSCGIAQLLSATPTSTSTTTPTSQRLDGAGTITVLDPLFCTPISSPHSPLTPSRSLPLPLGTTTVLHPVLGIPVYDSDARRSRNVLLPLYPYTFTPFTSFLPSSLPPSPSLISCHLSPLTPLLLTFS